MVAAFVASEFVVAVGALYLMRQSLGLDMAVNMAQAVGSAALTLLFFWRMPPLPFFDRRIRVRNRVLVLLGRARVGPALRP